MGRHKKDCQCEKCIGKRKIEQPEQKTPIQEMQQQK
jgi:hypothetical protein